MNPQEPSQYPAPEAYPPSQPQQAPPQPPEPQPQPPDRYHPAATPQVGNALSVTQPGERTLCTIKRHPIGILGVYAGVGFVLIVVAVLAFGVAPSVFSSMSSSQVLLVGALLFVVIAAICLGFALIATKVYWGNSWILTSDSLTQVLQNSLFSRQSSQLSLGNLEDVTAEQNGVLTRLFKYGVLRVETAGERSKFVFMYCPNPNYYAQQILSAREQFEQGGRGEEVRAAQSPQPPSPQSQSQSQLQSQPQSPGQPQPMSTMFDIADVQPTMFDTQSPASSQPPGYGLYQQPAVDYQQPASAYQPPAAGYEQQPPAGPGVPPPADLSPLDYPSSGIDTGVNSGL
jgi:hypothetical protein